MSYKLNWRGDEVERRVRRAVASRLADATVFAARQVQQNIGRQGPPASTPGEYPHRQTGELQSSVRAVIDTSALKSRVTATAPHAEAVERMRPFLSRTIKEIFGRIRRIMLKGS